MPIRTLHVGLGPIGLGIARQCATRRGFTVVGAVDISPDKVGQDLGTLIGLDRKLRVRVRDAVAAAIVAATPDVAVLCTSSSLTRVMPQIAEILKHKVPVVSTTEELAYPSGRNRALARSIDHLARRAKVAVLGTGVNPGFTMDALPIMLTGVCESVTAIRVERVQDAAARRLPFQQKIGAGLTVAQFAQRVRSGAVRHVGLTESISMIADAFGWKLSRISDEIHPKVADTEVSSSSLTVAPGLVSGLSQDGVGYRAGQPVITLHMEAYLGAPASYDAVAVEGTPPVHMTIGGGLHGDIATASIAVNSIPKVVSAPPGLRTMRDMVIPGWWSGRPGRG